MKRFKNSFFVGVLSSSVSRFVADHVWVCHCMWWDCDGMTIEMRLRRMELRNNIHLHTSQIPYQKHKHTHKTAHTHIFIYEFVHFRIMGIFCVPIWFFFHFNTNEKEKNKADT